MKSLSCVRLVSDPVDRSLPGSSMGFSKQEYWSGVPLPSPTQCEKLCFFSHILSLCSLIPWIRYLGVNDSDISGRLTWPCCVDPSGRTLSLGGKEGAFFHGSSIKWTTWLWVEHKGKQVKKMKPKKRRAGGSTSWNQDCQEECQSPQTCRWHPLTAEMKN